MSELDPARLRKIADDIERLGLGAWCMQHADTAQDKPTIVAALRVAAGGLWQSIETAPTDGSYVLLSTEHGVYVGSYWSGFHRWLGPCRHDIGTPTHWQPRPATA